MTYPNPLIPGVSRDRAWSGTWPGSASAEDHQRFATAWGRISMAQDLPASGSSPAFTFFSNLR
jgi:hypothetical protein